MIPDEPAADRYRKIAVLMGGPSAEREVSLASGKAVAGGLARAGYDVQAFDIVDSLPAFAADIDAVFIALHGEFGEDGQVQRRLEKLGLPYTGSGPEASRIAFDKRLSKGIFVDVGVPTPTYEILAPGATRTLALPVVVKPPCQGSTIGVHVVAVASQWDAAVADARQYGDEILVETYIPGRELTVGIVDDDPLDVVEVVAPDGWYGYEAKYTSGLTEYRVPAELPGPVAAACRAVAAQAFAALDCRGFGRVDFRLSPEGDLFALEVNTIPGFTETSLLPKAAAARGIEFANLCDRIMITSMPRMQPPIAG